MLSMLSNYAQRVNTIFDVQQFKIDTKETYLKILKRKKRPLIKLKTISWSIGAITAFLAFFNQEIFPNLEDTLTLPEAPLNYYFLKRIVILISFSF